MSLAIGSSLSDSFSSPSVSPVSSTPPPSTDTTPKRPASDTVNLSNDGANKATSDVSGLMGAMSSNFTQPPAASPTLTLGSRGDDVKALQQSLNAKGAHLKVDGILGPQTHKAMLAGAATPDAKGADPKAADPNTAATDAKTVGPNNTDWTKNLPEKMQGDAQNFVNAGKKYGVDPRFLAAISMNETGNGTSSAYRNKHNAMGISGTTGPKRFASTADSIDKMARTLAKPDGYYKGKNTIAGIANIYAPVGAHNDPHNLNSGWKSAVTRNFAKLGGDPTAAVK